MEILFRTMKMVTMMRTLMSLSLMTPNLHIHLVTRVLLFLTLKMATQSADSFGDEGIIILRLSKGIWWWGLWCFWVLWSQNYTFSRCRVLIVLDSKDGDDDEDIDVPEFDGPKYVDCGGVEDIIVSDFEEGADDEDFDFPKSDDPKYVNSDCQHQMPNPMTEEKWWNLEALQYQSWFQNIPLAWHDPSTKALVAIWFPGFFI